MPGTVRVTQSRQRAVFGAEVVGVGNLEIVGVEHGVGVEDRGDVPARTALCREPQFEVGPAWAAEGLWARMCRRTVVPDAAIRHNWLIGAPAKRSLIACDR